MKIISNFKDYYDYLFGINYEKGKVFKREFDIIKIKELKLNSYLASYNSNFYYEHNKHYEYDFIEGQLSFCEKIYPYIIAINTSSGTHSIYYELSEQLKKIIEYKFNLKYVDAFFNDISFNVKKYHKIHNTPIINHLNTSDYLNIDYSIIYKSKILENHKEGRYLEGITINTPLKLLNFYNIMPAEKAYQEISMYLSVLDNKENNECIINDKYRIASKGFDKKSFRKEKEQSKNKYS